MVPKELQPALAVFDVDGDGTISTKELSRAADLFEASQRKVRQLVQISALLIFLIFCVIGAIGGITYGLFVMTKTSIVQPGETVETVLGSDKPTAVAVAKIVSSKTLFDSHRESLDALKAVTSLTLHSKDGTQTFSYTITGFMKEATEGAVTFYSSRGDEIRCSGSDIQVTSACEVPAGQSSCKGAVLLILRRNELQARRRLLLEAVNNVAGRRLESNQLRRLQRHLQAAQDPKSKSHARSDEGASNATPCPDGTTPVAGECPRSCEANLPEVCPTEPGQDCQCPVPCSPGMESCFIAPGTSGWRCSSFDVPFQKKSTGCIPVCSETRNLTTGQCSVMCSDGKTMVPEKLRTTGCPLLCPDLRAKAKKLGLSDQEIEDALGVAYLPVSVFVTSTIENDVTLQVKCPKLCRFEDPFTPSGVKVIPSDSSKDFNCPRKCYDREGKELKDRHSDSSVYAWPDESCPKVCSQTGGYVQGSAHCPIYCPDLDGKPIATPSGVPITFTVTDAASENINAQRLAVCPELCSDGSFDWTGEGCTYTDSSSSEGELVECPGKPTDCDGQLIRMTHEADCPYQCATLRNCKIKQDGLIFPESDKTCPISCNVQDEEGKPLFDWGYGCPKRCVPGFPGVPKFGLAPYWTCPVMCLNADSSYMRKNGFVVFVFPVKERLDTVTGKTERMVLNWPEDDIQALLCPIRCTNSARETFVDPYWSEGEDGWWLKSLHGQDFTNCPSTCADGTTVIEKYGESCAAATAPLWAGSASAKASHQLWEKSQAWAVGMSRTLG
eukprot:TRINITY_DN62871_c0_g1_i1.p1 TRINITY_DN62871_c0_g1~~TRINITY_DN62871_c0_g1_i1.p1  ORF type:complete len:905 (-),score=162.78 TRINITY_DN62871_c0_g1_i1:21-2366(-)